MIDKLKALAGGTSHVDYVQKSIGDFGKYQFWLCMLVFLSKVPVAWHQMAIIFISPKQAFQCNGEDNKCPCENPEFDTSVFTYTIGMKWKLICERKYLTSFVQMLFQLGILIGSVVFGMASDKWGRRPPFLIATVIQVIVGLGTAYMDSFILFNALRFIMGLAIGGTMVIGFVSCMEFCGTKYRPPISALYHLPFNIGHLTLPVFGYYFRDFTEFQVAVSVPISLLLVYFCLLPETPRWLLAMKRTEDAIKLCERVAKVNNLPTASIRADLTSALQDLERQSLKKGTLVDLFRTPNLRKHILSMAFVWFSCGYCFYGLSQYVSLLSGNIFMNVAMSATGPFIGSVVSVPLLDLMKRKTMLLVFLGSCSICLIMLAVIPEGLPSVACACIGNLGAFIAFLVVYLYCTELFPTVVRNAAIGFSSGSARFGSMVAPFVVGLRDIGTWLPPLVFALPPTIGFMLSLFFLPETKGCPLMTTLKEGEDFGKKKPTSPKE